MFHVGHRNNCALAETYTRTRAHKRYRIDMLMIEPLIIKLIESHL